MNLSSWNRLSRSNPSILNSKSTVVWCPSFIHKKIVQFATIFYLLNHGHPMSECEAFGSCFPSKKHWIDASGWGMGKAMHDVVLPSTKAIVQVVNYWVQMRWLYWTTNNGLMSMSMSWGFCSDCKIVYVKNLANLVWVLGLVVWKLREGFLVWVLGLVVWKLGEGFQGCVGARLRGGRGSISPKEICFIAIARQTQFSYRQNC
jgi:hypothetical protein